MPKVEEHVTLADTPRGKAWIDTFRPEHQEVARLLLNTLHCVSHNTFQREVRSNISVATTGLQGPIAFYAAREVREGESYFLNKRDRPIPLEADKKLGSEGTLANLITGITREDPDRLLNHPPVQTLYDRRCRDIVILDDISGSGDRIAEFLRAFRRNKYVKSWYSLGWLTFHVVAYAISEEAESAIELSLQLHGKRDPNVIFKYSRRPETFPLFIPNDLRDQLEELCKSYGQERRVRWQYRLGYRSGMGTVVFAHGCPNNVPGILWTGAVSPDTLMFPNRGIPEDLIPIFDGDPIPPVTRNVFSAIHAEKLRASFESGELDSRSQSVFLVLAAIRKKIRRPDRIAQATNLPQRICDEVIGNCVSLGLIDENHYLTERGLEELHHAEAIGKMPFEPPPLTDSFYVPKTLRATRA